jgi:hypothetical protein
VTSAIQEINESPDTPASWNYDSVTRPSVTHPQVN